jgi:hypothetical protein
MQPAQRRGESPGLRRQVTAHLIEEAAAGPVEPVTQLTADVARHRAHAAPCRLRVAHVL